MDSRVRGKRTKRHHGFSLPELLVVIGIIALLLAILLPVIGKVRVSANKVKCSAQLAQLGHAFQGYLNDATGKVPLVNPLPEQNPARFQGPPIWNAFDRYLSNNRAVWRCPADRAINVGTEFPAGKETYADAFGLSYEYNFWLNTFHGGNSLRSALNDAKTRLNIDSNEFRVFNDFSHFHGPAGRAGNMNFLFADWHVGDLGAADRSVLASPG